MSNLTILKDVETSYEWTGGVNASPSVEIKGGEVTRTNWVPNPGFDGPDLSWIEGSGDEMIYRTPLDPYYGTQSLHVLAGNPGTFEAEAYTYIDGVDDQAVGKSVLVSMFFKAYPGNDAGGSDNWVQINFGVGQSEVHTFRQSESGWVHVKFETDAIVTPSTSIQVNIGSTIQGSGTMRAGFWVDALMVEVIDPEYGYHPYFDGNFQGRITSVPDYSLELLSTSITLDSNSLDSSDLTGTVGTFSVNVVRPESPSHPLNQFGADILARKKGRIHQVSGHSLGVTITSVAESENASTLQISGGSFATPLVNFNRRIRPLVFPNLAQALDHLIFYDVETQAPGDPIVTERVPDVSVAYWPELYDEVPGGVVVPGLFGEGWTFLKQFCAAYDLMIEIRDSLLEIRKNRVVSREIMEGISKGHTTNEPTLAQFVEVVQYNYSVPSGPFVEIPLYPPGGWSEDVEILTVNAGEATEYELEMSAFANNITPVNLSMFIPREQITPGFTVVADDGLPLSPAQWFNFGGKLEVGLGETFSTLIVKLRGPDNFITSEGEPSRSFSIALASDGSGSRYSTLRVGGHGFSYEKETLRIPTGVSAQETATEVGVVIDNPFISNRNQSMRAAVNAAVRFSGYNPRASGENPLTAHAPLANGIIRRNGRPYRIVTTTDNGGTIGWEAEDALDHGDVQDVTGEMTYADIQADNENFSHFDVMIRGAKY